VNGGIAVRCNASELLLEIPKKAGANLQYRLYNSDGQLLTWSDGTRTKIYPYLRMDGVAHGWSPPA
jgi:hypothetical protein